MLFPTAKSSIEVPEFTFPSSISNHGNYIISLGEFCQWLAEEAENTYGVDILPGVTGNEVIFDGDRVAGIRTGDMGIDKFGNHKESFEPGIDVIAKQTLFTEGARGSLTEQIKKVYSLDSKSPSVQHYGIGFKEIWQVSDDHPYFEPGLV